MKGKVVTCVVSLAILFITASFSQADTFDLAKMNSPPTTPSVPSGPISGSSGTYYIYSMKATDADGDQVKYKIDWGDGTTSNTCLFSQNIAAKLRHKWIVASGTKAFNVRTTAIDEHGVASGWSGALSVTIKASSTSTPTIPTSISNNPPATPSVPSGPTSGSSGTSYSYSAKATDRDGNRVKYTFDWGDGTPLTTTSLVSSGTSASASHAWTVASGTKTFSVRAKTTDEKGTASSWSSASSVTIKASSTSTPTTPTSISNNPPATPSIPIGCFVGCAKYPKTYKSTATDPDGDLVKITINWGDGTETTTDYVASNTEISATHTWKVTPGTSKEFLITAMATDDHGMKSQRSPALPVVMFMLAEPTMYMAYMNTEEANLVSEQINGSDFVDTEPQEADSVDREPQEADSVDREPQEADFVDTEPQETDSVDTEPQETDFVDTEPQETDFVDTEPQETDFVDTEPQETDSVDDQAEAGCPLAVDDIYSMESNSSILKINTPGVLENDQYKSEESITVVSCSRPSHAADFSMNSDGSFTYIGNENYCGEDRFTYKLVDGNCESHEATVTISKECDQEVREKILY